MKQYLTLLSACALIFLGGSCAKFSEWGTDSIDATPREIIFDANASQPVTKTIVSGTTMTQDFGVYGYVKPTDNVTTGGYIMKDGHYNSSGNVVGSTHYYWPKAKNNETINVNFVAYSPYSLDATFANDVITIPVSASATANTSCTDVLYAYTENVHPQNASSSHTRVPLHFNHALAWVEFKACMSSEVTSATITSITLSSNLYTTGSITIDVTDPSNTITYTGEGGAVAFDFAEATPEALTTDYRILSDALIFPQDVPATVTITYDITLPGADGTIVYSGRQVTKTINTGTDMSTSNPHDYLGKWNAANKYIYQIKITAEEIDFSVDINDWRAIDTHPFQVWDHDALAYVERLLA